MKIAKIQTKLEDLYDQLSEGEDVDLQKVSDLITNTTEKLDKYKDLKDYVEELEKKCKKLEKKNEKLEEKLDALSNLKASQIRSITDEAVDEALEDFEDDQDDYDYDE